MESKEIMATLGCSQRMATQAMHLSLEKGTLATPYPKTGKKLPENVSEAVENFYRQDDISRQRQITYGALHASKESASSEVAYWSQEKTTEYASNDD
eukprot:gene5798-11094_t